MVSFVYLCALCGEILPSQPRAAALHINYCFLCVLRGLCGQTLSAVGMMGASVTAPSRKLTVLPEIAGTRSLGTTIPARLSGSAAEMGMIWPVGWMLLIAR